MPQKFVTSNRRTTTMKKLEIGQLAEVQSGLGYDGMVVTKIYEGTIVAVVGNKSNRAFQSTWTEHADLPVRILEPGESVELTN